LVDPPLGDHPTVDRDHRDPPVVQGVKVVVRVDIPEFGLYTKRPQRAQGFVAKVAALPRDKHDLHSPEATRS
jgi:hypothetical protein